MFVYHVEMQMLAQAIAVLQFHGPDADNNSYHREIS